MDILQQLLNNELLTEDTKLSIQQAFSDMRNQIVESETARIETEVTAKLTEQFITEREMLIEAVDAKLGSLLEAELSELKQSISEFRDLEVEHETKLVEAKQDLAKQLQQDLVSLVHIVESFLDERIATEINEIKEDINEARKLDFGRRIVEAFGSEWASTFNPANELAAQLKEATDKLNEATAKLQAAEADKQKLNENHSKVAHQLRMERLLGNLSGSKREVMEQLLKDVKTEKLEEKYQAYLPRLIDTPANVEAPASNITESVQVDINKTQVKTGDANNLAEGSENRTTSVLTEEQRNYLRTLGGIGNK